MSLTVILSILVGVLAIALIVVLLMATRYKKVGPNEALIISGGRKRIVVDPDGTKKKVGYRIQVGGGKLLMPFIHMAQSLPLEVLTIETKTDDALTLQGIPLTADGVAQVKVGASEHAIRTAAEQFLSRGIDGMKKVSNQILEGYVRATLGKLTVEEVYQDREAFSKKIMDMARADFSKLGLEVLAFNLREIRDSQGYLEALGRPKIAEVKRDATVAEAETDMDSKIKSARAMKAANAVALTAEAEIAALKGQFEAKKAEFMVEVNERKARADMSYDLERHRMNQMIKTEEAKVRIIEKDNAIRLEEKEIQRKEMELETTVKRPADARRYQVEAEAEAERVRLEKEAEGRSRAARIEGAARAEIVRLMGGAEAEAMAKKADSWSRYNQAAVFEKLIDIMPQLAAAVAQPLSKVEKIILVNSGGASGIGASKITGEVTSILAQLPTLVEALSGVDLKGLVGALPQVRPIGEGPDTPSSNPPVGKPGGAPPSGPVKE